MLKLISHFKRLSTPIPKDEPLKRFATIRNVRKQSADPETRSIRTVIEKVTIDRAEEMRPFRVSDFNLDNLIAVGAKLNPTHYAASPHKAVTDMAAPLSSIEVNNSNE